LPRPSRAEDDWPGGPRAGVDARPVVFEALPHAFWNNPGLPERKEADAVMAKFLGDHLGK
jgi:hypothetical protein